MVAVGTGGVRSLNVPPLSGGRMQQGVTYQEALHHVGEPRRGAAGCFISLLGSPVQGLIGLASRWAGRRIRRGPTALRTRDSSSRIRPTYIVRAGRRLVDRGEIARNEWLLARIERRR